MHATLEDWKNGWFGVSLGLTAAEIDGLIAMLTMIRNDAEQHFHLSSTYEGGGGLGDIEVYSLPEGYEHNMTMSGPALGPGYDV